MDKKGIAFEVKVGMFILVGFVILLLMIFSIGDIYFIRPGYHIKVVFNFANGIAKNAPVRLAGIEVGEVDDLKIYYDGKEERTKVELSAWIKRNNIMIESDSRAVINTLGILGEKYLEIFPGKGKSFLKECDVLVGKDPVSMEDMTGQFKQLADSFTVVMERLKNGEGTVGKFLTDDSIYNNLEEFTADIKANPWKLMNRPK
ncbi:MAG: MlaD family protein [Candidatus Omnitrophica bacterium]|nr:MlaD family protein [Candidatus Omnitrophota bacterium]